MDVRDLMAFKPSQTPKRPAPGEAPLHVDELMEDDPSDTYEASAKKRKLAMKKAQEVLSYNLVHPKKPYIYTYLNELFSMNNV